MFRIMLQKMWHKKWMNVCLLLGCILLTATVVSFPIYRSAAYDRMLNDEFENYTISQGKWAALVYGNVSVKKETGGGTIKKMDDFPKYFYDTMGVKEKETFFLINLTSLKISSETKRKDGQGLTARLGAINNMPEHATILSGEMYSDTGVTEDGAIECVVSQSCLINLGVLVGEYFTYDDLRYKNGELIRMYVTGVFDAADNSGYFWQTKPEALNDMLLCNPDVFRERFTGDNASKFSLVSSVSVLFDYQDLKASDVERISKLTDYLYKESSYRSVLKEPAYLDVFASYNIRVSRISTTLLILQIPILAMLATFLFMISSQMYEMEKNEISVIKSRGSSKGQIILLYLYQGLFITITGGILGLPLGALFAKMLGSTRNFLEFDLSETLNVAYTKESFIYLCAAVFVCLLSIVVPSIKHSKVSIVKLKQSKAAKRKAWWEKLFLDIILLGVSIYGYYSFNKNGGNLSNTVLEGESLDPLLYISSSVFILGAGLFFLRIQPYIVRLIYLIGKNHWGPASHVSFMENIKNGRKQQLIMLFLIMTISLGMYHATVARTILENAIDNTEYLAGTDVIIKENWVELADRYGVSTGDYVVPNYSKYNSMEAAQMHTKVIFDDKASIKQSGNEMLFVTVMGINTKEFGTQTMVDRSLLDKNYYEFLNDLAVVEDGVLLSKNFQTIYGYKEGDSITFYNNKKKYAIGTVIGFVDYFPGYSATENGLNADGTAYTKDNFLIVSHYDYLVSKWGTTPYEVWIKLVEDAKEIDVYNWIVDNNVEVSKYVNKISKMESTLSDPLLQGTNGVLTMGFVVTIVLCAVGYLIYWVMSIRERELIFGVLRATGLHKSEIMTMLINEQIFCGLFSVLAGIGIGKLTSTLFVPILQQAYASQDQALPMKLIMVASDMYRLYAVIGLVMLLALGVLAAILSRMNVTKALKLGEE
ncbi:MAG: FtsX-like permease family protein [Lachnospiraceae bacterium]|nr:FtsX-like permease family protein [Lachnospiraceae bacterium]